MKETIILLLIVLPMLGGCGRGKNLSAKAIRISPTPEEERHESISLLATAPPASAIPIVATTPGEPSAPAPAVIPRPTPVNPPVVPLPPVVHLPPPPVIHLPPTPVVQLPQAPIPAVVHQAPPAPIFPPPPPAEESELDFGPLFGYVDGRRVSIPPGYSRCPYGYYPNDVYGQYDEARGKQVDYWLTYCTRKHIPGVPSYLVFGGMYGWIDGERKTNPATKDASCPPNFHWTRILDTYDGDYPVWVCWAWQGTGVTTNILFGGMAGFLNGANYIPNPRTGNGPPAGYTRYHVLGYRNVDWPLMFDAKVLWDW